MTAQRIHRLHLLDVICLILMIAGGLNWLMVGIFQLDLVATTFGAVSMGLGRIVYLLVGIAAIYGIVRLPSMTHYRYEPAERERYVASQP
jgi:uncharacterized membrane protein YuzA (DUF378 family)